VHYLSILQNFYFYCFRTQDTEEGTSNTGHEIIPDIITPQNIQSDDINNEEMNGYVNVQV